MANEEHGHVALPKLYGAPAYARPPRAPVAPVDRPFDPDELPLESVRTEEEQQIADELRGRPYAGAAPADPLHAPGNGTSHPHGRPFRLGSITGRLRGKDNGTGS